ncbi:MAG: SusC/RagA family TonB-linked outer membrane protein, partial [Tannerellaceae bacterium]|nr:SusC/RagA family TonB-linked outer membrane protein [Tannerellaceae bacterium]
MQIKNPVWRIESRLILFLCLLIPFTGFAQTKSVQGIALDNLNEPVIGVSVLEKGTTNGTITNMDGEFTLNVSENATLLITYIGYESKEVSVAGRNRVNLVLSENTELLDEVVVIGYGTVRKADVTTAISVISTDDLDLRPITSVSSAIQGKAAGVQVVQPSGKPGAGMVVRIRGASSISSSNDPLYVVDGVPVGEGEYAIAFLSPNDIESMQILKDASSAAIYGSRAANGVVLITTKAGANKEPRISFSAYAGISKVSKTYDVLNVAQYKDLMDEMGVINLPDGLRDETDWFKETYRTGVSQNYQLSYSGGNEKTNYYVGGGYSNEDGVLKAAYNRRYNVRVNIDTQVRKWVKFSTNVNYSHYKNNDIISGQGANRAGVVASVISTPTYAKVWDEENPNWYWNNFYGANLTNPVENMGRTEYNYEATDRFIGTIGALFTLMEGLNFKTTVSMDRRWVHKFEFLDPVRTSDG